MSFHPAKCCVDVELPSQKVTNRPLTSVLKPPNIIDIVSLVVQVSAIVIENKLPSTEAPICPSPWQLDKSSNDVTSSDPLIGVNEPEHSFLSMPSANWAINSYSPWQDAVDGMSTPLQVVSTISTSWSDFHEKKRAQSTIDLWSYRIAV